MKVRQRTQRIAMMLLASVLFVQTALATEYVSASKEGVFLQAGPKNNATSLFQLPAGYPLEVLSKEGQWLKVSDYEGDKGYIQASLVTKTPHVIIKAKECKIRAGAGTHEKIVGNGVNGVIFTKVEQKGDWIKVAHPSLSGWVHKDMLWP